LKIFGNIPHLIWNGKWERQFAAWGKRYNGLYTFWFGTLPTIMIADYDIAVEILIQNGDACSSRGNNEHFNNLCREGTYGLVLTSGELWKEQRKFMTKVLRDFGMGTNLMQEKVGLALFL
jgi:hypothetical protein